MMLSKYQEHFLIFLPRSTIIYGASYGALIGGIGIGCAYFIIERYQTEFPTNGLLLVLCTPVWVFAGFFIGLFWGGVFGLLDSFLVSIITPNFITTGLLWSDGVLYRNVLRIGCALLNNLIGLLIFRYLLSTPWLIASLCIINIATFLACDHFTNWYPRYLVQHPKLLWELTGIDIKRLQEPAIWQEIRDLITYSMPEIPNNLGQYTDGELPAELLRQFLTDGD